MMNRRDFTRAVAAAAPLSALSFTAAAIAALQHGHGALSGGVDSSVRLHSQLRNWVNTQPNFASRVWAG